MRRRRRARLLAPAVFALATLLVGPVPSWAGTGQDGSMPAFNESSGCGSPPNHKPAATRSGWLPDSSQVRGPMADYLGRSLGQIRSQLVWWDVPMSNGERIQIHERALPAFERVASNLAAEAANGKHYSIRSIDTYGFAPRTISGSYTYSYHALGTAVDINSASNPFRRDNTLITNMPGWFVAAWTEAGFCWGGDWQDLKDPMHFSWRGPSFTPGFGEPGPSQPVSTSSAGFTNQVQDRSTPFGPAGGDSQWLVADGSGDGAVDVVRLRENDYGVLIEYSRAGDGHEWCSVRRDHALDAQLAGTTALMGDHGATGRNDLWLVGESGGLVEVAIYSVRESFDASATFATDLSAEPGDVYLVGDHDGDRRADLFVVRRGPTTVVEVRLGPDFTTGPSGLLTDLGDTSSSSWHFAAGDRDLDGASDLHALDSDSGTLHILLAASAYASTADTLAVGLTAGVAALALSDFDGDGRGDLRLFGTDGRFRALLGNAATYSNPESWFRSPGTRCDSDDIPYEFDGRFRDDDGNVHESDIEAIAARGITMGCNPPYGDEYCPDREVTRGEIAAFLRRLLDLAATTTDHFTDDGESLFAADIDALAEADVVRGCNPPDNTRYCPDQNVTRAELAAMLVRALELPGPPPGDPFVDDNGSIFEASIESLAAAGVTRGCNPPSNDRFCPSSPVTRDQMASFLERSAKLLEAAS